MGKKFKELSAEELRKIILRKDDQYKDLQKMYEIEQRSRLKAQELRHKMYDLESTIKQDEMIVTRYKRLVNKLRKKLRRVTVFTFVLIISLLLSLLAVFHCLCLRLIIVCLTQFERIE